MRFIALAFVMISAAGCKSVGGGRGTERLPAQSFAADYETVWKACHDVLAEMAVPIRSAKDGLIRTQKLRYGDRAFRFELTVAGSGGAVTVSPAVEYDVDGDVEFDDEAVVAMIDGGPEEEWDRLERRRAMGRIDADDYAREVVRLREEARREREDRDAEDKEADDRRLKTKMGGALHWVAGFQESLAARLAP